MATITLFGRQLKCNGTCGTNTKSVIIELDGETFFLATWKGVFMRKTRSTVLFDRYQTKMRYQLALVSAPPLECGFTIFFFCK